MRAFIGLAWAGLVLLSPAASTAGLQSVFHDLSVRIDPDENRITASDHVTFPGKAPRPGALEFWLHKGLAPSVEGRGAVLSLAFSDEYASRYIIDFPGGVTEVTLRYSGVINHPLEAVGEEYARGQQATSGTISPEGVFLSSNSLWYPVFEGAETFVLEVDVPEGWDAVSQGNRTAHRTTEGRRIVAWEESRPQQEIYLVAGRYREYISREDDFTAMVFLRKEDDALAKRYLDATNQYVRMFSDLLGPYPYDKFALVENFWETGYGMPSFTLLGPRVIRFPFILHSSYPHEILHNWWGNGVFIDYGQGNWGEGLTAYLADHLIKEQRGDAAEHRRTILQKYADYVLKGRDLPLVEFRSRHGSVSEAVGYGKSLMLFHMLRRRIGDERFTDGLRRFFREHLFDTAGYDALRESFEQASGEKLDIFFSEWTEKTGAPELRLLEAAVTSEGSRHMLTGRLKQVQKDAPFSLTVPLAVTLAGSAEAVVDIVEMDGREESFTVALPGPPLRLDVDPAFDVFRRLDRTEIPPALSSAFGAEKALIVMPSDAPAEKRQAYETLAVSLRRTGPGQVDVISDSDVESLPADRSVWILGWENRFFEKVPPALREYDISFGAHDLLLEKARLPRGDHAFVVSGRHPSSPDQTLLWIALDDIDSVSGLARKLPHYHKYSYLAFEGKEPANVAKGRWPVTRSPLTHSFAAGGTPLPAMGTLPPERPLAELKPLFSATEMMKTVERLSADRYEGRGVGSEGLAAAALSIAERFEALGLVPFNAKEGPGGYLQSWVHDGDPEGAVELSNVVGLVKGTDAERGAVVLGAHYDHLGMGSGKLGADVRKGNEGLLHPGADDNASGIAVLLEVARSFAGVKPLRTLYVVAFTGEETGRLGSKHFIESLSAAGAAAPFAMINVDTVGRLEGKQFLILGGSSASEWVHIFRGAGFLTGVEVRMVSEDLDASDQVSFIDAGIPAVQISSGPSPDYHRPGDKAARVDSQGLVKAASLTRESLAYLADREEPLSVSPSSPGSRVTTGGGGPRRISLGTIPDFAFAGPGVRITGTVDGSPADVAGLRDGDILTAVGEKSLSGLRDLSAVLKSAEAGSSVIITYTRDGRENRVEAILEER